MMYLNSILNAVETPGTFGEKSGLALTTLLIGMLTVFSAMIIIMVVIWIIGKVFQAKEKKQKEKASDAQTNVPAPVISEAETAPAETSNEEEIVAAITAAVALLTEEPVGSFRVVSFKKTSAKPAWNKK